MGRTSYPSPQVVLFSTRTASACGAVVTEAGPRYCPVDRRVYLDTAFFGVAPELRGSGDFARAYVIVHVVSHHVQNVLGALPLRDGEGPATEASRQLQASVELQADCYTGVWAFHARQRGLLEAGDLEQAPIAQRWSDAPSHGTAEQRLQWFDRGLASGDPRSCEPLIAGPR
jgi:predicted metalloprotease